MQEQFDAVLALTMKHEPIVLASALIVAPVLSNNS